MSLAFTGCTTVSAVNGLSSRPVANQIAPIQSQEFYLVPWCSFTSLCKLKLEAVTYHETYTVDFPGFTSRYSFYYDFSRYPVVHT